jgi:hypothetical protein
MDYPNWDEEPEYLIRQVFERFKGAGFQIYQEDANHKFIIDELHNALANSPWVEKFSIKEESYPLADIRFISIVWIEKPSGKLVHRTEFCQATRYKPLKVYKDEIHGTYSELCEKPRRGFRSKLRLLEDSFFR